MKHFIFTLMLFVAFAAGARTVKLSYGEFDKDLQQMASFEDIDLLKIILTTDSAGAEYDLVAVTVSPDSVSEKLISEIIPLKLSKDTTEMNVFAKPLGTDSVKIRLTSTNYSAQTIKVPTFMCILYNYITQSEFNGDEEIPLFAYASGAEFEMNFGGKTVKARSYCEVRQSGKHPSEWGKAFNLPTYIYYTLRPRE